MVLELRVPFRDGTTHFVFESQVFIERLAALAPPPRMHQLTYHGVWRQARAGLRELLREKKASPENSASGRSVPTGLESGAGALRGRCCPPQSEDGEGGASRSPPVADLPGEDPNARRPSGSLVLERLSELDARQARVVELRFFGGLSVEETAGALWITRCTVKGDWQVAKAWLNRGL